MTRVPKYAIKRGAVGAVITEVMRDVEGKPIPLGGKRVTLAATRSRPSQQPGEKPALSDVECRQDPNQFQNAGRVSYAFDEKTANIPAGIYNLEYKIQNEDGSVVYFPAGGYAKLTVLESLS